MINYLNHDCGFYSEQNLASLLLLEGKKFLAAKLNGQLCCKMRRKKKMPNSEV